MTMTRSGIARRAIVSSFALLFVQRPANAKLIQESQAGDPDGPSEELEFDSSVMESMLSANRASFDPKIANFRERLIEEASLWVGKGRAGNKEEIARLLALFNLKFEGSKGPTPYCAAGISFVAAMVYARHKKPKDEFTLSTVQNYVAEVDKYHFYPTPNVEGMHLVSRAKDNWVPPFTKSVMAAPQPGWLVLFQWNGQNHVGLVEKVLKDRIQTIEFNTTPEGRAGSDRQGGVVARRNRAYPAKFVRGFIST